MIYKKAFKIPYDADIELVRKIFKQIGKDLLKDEEVGPHFIEPFKSQGVFAMEDSYMVIRAKFMCKPREQFMIRREAFKAVKAKFEENGIAFAHRNVTVHVASGSGPAASHPEEIAEAAAAAGEIVIAEEQPTAPATDKR